MRLDKQGQPAHAIAKRFDLSDDHLTYTFHLREAKWSNGDPVIAYDFEYAWKKVLDPGFQTHFAYAFFMIQNAREANEGLTPIDEVGVRAIDDKTLEVKLTHPAPYFLELTAHWTYFPVSSKLDSSHPGWAYSAADAYISCGPFKLTRYDYGSKLELEANPQYWDASSVKLEKIEIFTIPDLNAVLKMYENDELDWIGQPFSVLPSEQVADLSTKNKLIETPISAITWLDINTESFPLNCKKMRQAFCLGIQRTKLQKNNLKGSYRPATSILPSSVQLNSEPYFEDGDTKKAKALFDEALEELALTRDKLPPISFACADGPQQTHIAELIKEQLEKLFNIEVQFKVYSWDEFFNRRNNSFFQLSLLTWYCWYSDPSYVLDVFKFRTNALNATQWENSTYISLLDQAQASTDPEERKQLYIKAEQILIDESPVIPLFYDNDLYLKKDRLKGYSFSQTGDVDFKEAYMERLI
jgi:oligopeptide transport system substrate-binding protein